MIDTYNRPSSDTIDLNSQEVWGMAADKQENPAAQARDEYLQHQYAEALATPEPVVNESEPVLAEPTYAPDAIDPARAAATAAVQNAYEATPEMLAGMAAQQSQEQLRAAVTQAGVYAHRIVAMRNHADAIWNQEPPLN